MFNLCTKFIVPVCSRYDDMNRGAKCTNWGSFGQLGVARGHTHCHHPIECIDFLFDFNRNYVYRLVPFSRYSQLFVESRRF